MRIVSRHALKPISFSNAFSSALRAPLLSRGDDENAPPKTSLYKGDAALQRAGAIAETSWEPNAKLRVTGTFAYQGLKTFLKRPDIAVLGVYKNIVIVAAADEVRQEAQPGQILNKMIAILNHGETHATSRALNQSLASSKLPLVIFATERDCVGTDCAVPAENPQNGELLYGSNFDTIRFNPALAYKLKDHDVIQAPWINFYHEAAHVQDYGIARQTFLDQATPEQKALHPAGYAYSPAGVAYLKGDTIDENGDAGQNRIEDGEDRATKYERELTPKNKDGVALARKKYYDFDAYEKNPGGRSYYKIHYYVPDPIVFDQDKASREEHLVWLHEADELYYKNKSLTDF